MIKINSALPLIILKIYFLNTRGIENNIDYINQIAFASDILFINETWHKNIAEIDTALYLMGKKIFECSGQKLKNKRGRFPGGYAFIINKDINAVFTKLNERIGLIKINKLAIIGVYLPYFGGIDAQKRDSNAFEYESCLAILKQITHDQRLLGMELIILGDFNTDFTRTNKQSIQLAAFMRDTKMIAADLAHPQVIDYTFVCKRTNKINNLTTQHYSWIDHLLTENLMLNVKDVHIESTKNSDNQSDHCHISFTYNLKPSKTHLNSNVKAQQNTYHINWQNSEESFEYTHKVNSNLTPIELILDKIDTLTCTNKIVLNLTDAIQSLFGILIQAKQRTSNYFRKTKKKKAKKGIMSRKMKS